MPDPFMAVKKLFERRIAEIEAAVRKTIPTSSAVFDAFGTHSELSEPDRDDGLPNSDHRRH